MSKLLFNQNLTIKSDIKPLKQLKRLSYAITQDRQSLKYPSSIELLTLATNLCYQAHLILNNEVKCKKGLCVESYIVKAIEVQKILDNYEISYIDMREFNKIKKEFGLNRL